MPAIITRFEDVLTLLQKKSEELLERYRYHMERVRPYTPYSNELQVYDALDFEVKNRKKLCEKIEELELEVARWKRACEQNAEIIKSMRRRK